MDTTKRSFNIAWTVLPMLCLVAFLVGGGVYFAQYLNEQIFEERSTQLVEITSQVRTTLKNALNAQWGYLDASINGLEALTAEGETTLEALGLMEEMLELEDSDSFLILLDAQGNSYDATGKRGLWSDFGLLSAGEDRFAFISHTDLYDSSSWAFVQKLSEPLAGEGGVTFTHLVLLKDIQSIIQYYDSAAYGSNNETYILKSDGTRVHDDVNQSHSISSYNVLRDLQAMEGQRLGDIRVALEQDDTVSSNFWMNGEEYYCCITSLPEFDTLLVFLIPAASVAAGTVSMMETMLGTLLGLVAVVLLLVVLAVVAVLRQRNSTRMARQEKANAQAQEALNVELAEANEKLAASKESVEQAFQIAERANQAKSSFLSSMSHDIRTPMNAIVGFSSLLSRDASNPEKVQEYAGKITSSSQHLLGLINDVLDISKIEAGKTTLNLTEERVSSVVEAVDAIIRPQMIEHRHRFDVVLDEVQHDVVMMDRVRLNQILLNLLSNAMKYTPDGGRVSFEVTELPQLSDRLARFRFTVTDNGYGMSEDYLKVLFDTFSREEDEITRQIQGTGLGMTITKNLVDLMGGVISVESEKGVGSTFVVELELQIAEGAVIGEVKAEDESEVSVGSALSGLNILAAEDNLFNAELLRELLGLEGASVNIQENGQAVLQAFEASEPGTYDLILMDVQMPVMNGYEATKAIRSSSHVSAQTIPIVAMTADAFAEDIRRALDAGMNAHVAKPIDMAALDKTVREVLKP